MSVPRYYLRTEWESVWKRVTKKQYIEAERNAGFYPTHISIADPEYNNTCATSGFSDDSVEGKIT